MKAENSELVHFVPLWGYPSPWNCVKGGGLKEKEGVMSGTIG
jgi:hypothetical protein